MRWSACVLSLAFAVLFVAHVGWGIDFGDHWDEGALLEKVEWSVTSGGILLPPTYDWPSASYWVAVATLAPELSSAGGLQSSDLSRWEQSLVEHLRSVTFKLRLRWAFALLTALSIVWVFAASRALGGSLFEASTAAAMLAVAWEPGYHARFAVPDGLLMQFGALALCCTIVAARQPASRWLFVAAIACGLAVGTKYAAWPLLIPVLWIAATAPLSRARRARRMVQMCAVAFGAFLITTPGALFMPVRFAQALVLQWSHYATGHGVHTVDAGGDHLWRMLEYLGLELLSPYSPIAVCFAALAVVGMWSLWRTAPSVAIAVGAFPVAYVLYFSLQRVMIVRNLIILAPFLAVAAARGIAALSALVPGRALRAVPYVLASVALAANGAFAVAAASTIARRQTIDLAGEARAWVQQASVAQVGVSPGVAAAMADTAVHNGKRKEAAAQRWLTLLHEPVCGEPIPANVRGLITLIAGPREINVTRYPDWVGDPHLVVVDLDTLRRAGACQATAG